jgi:PEP-CTERM motif
MTNHVKYLVMAASAATLALPQLAAHAQTYTQLDSGVTGLRYTLVDLAPEDGITPALTWTTGMVGVTATHAQAIPNLGVKPATYDAYAFDRIVEFPDGSMPVDYVDVAKTTDATWQAPSTLALLGTSTIDVATDNGNGVQRFSSTGVSSSSRVTADQVRTEQLDFEVPAAASGYPPGFAVSRTVSFASTTVEGIASPTADATSFTLTPNTAVRFDGALYIKGQIDASSLINKMNAVLESPAYSADYYAYIGGNMGSFITLSGGTDAPSATAGVSDFFDWGSTYRSNEVDQAELNATLVGYGFSGIVYLPDNPVNVDESQDFNLVFSNATDQDRMGTLRLGATSDASYKFFGRVTKLTTDIPVGDVPEPSTWLLMALGLGTVAVVRQRR